MSDTVCYLSHDYIVKISVRKTKIVTRSQKALQAIVSSAVRILPLNAWVAGYANIIDPQKTAEKTNAVRNEAMPSTIGGSGRSSVKEMAVANNRI